MCRGRNASGCLPVPSRPPRRRPFPVAPLAQDFPAASPRQVSRNEFMLKAIKVRDVIECMDRNRAIAFLVFGKAIFEDVEPRSPRIMAKPQWRLVGDGSMRESSVDALALIPSLRLKFTGLGGDKVGQFGGAEIPLHLGKITPGFHHYLRLKLALHPTGLGGSRPSAFCAVVLANELNSKGVSFGKVSKVNAA